MTGPGFLAADELVAMGPLRAPYGVCIGGAMTGGLIMDRSHGVGQLTIERSINSANELGAHTRVRSDVHSMCTIFVYVYIHMEPYIYIYIVEKTTIYALVTSTMWLL